MAEGPKHETPFEDPFESHVVKDPFVDDHFGGNNQQQTFNQTDGSGGTSSVWSENLPDSTAILVLGILSIIGSFCYGIVGLILGIIGLAMAGRPEKLYRQQPTRYSQSSYSNMKAGKVCAIIGLCLSSLWLLGLLAIFVAAAGDFRF
jgi:hypothetical protein